MLVRATLRDQYKSEGQSSREKGLYRLGLAEGTLDHTRISGLWYYVFQASAPTVEEVRELYLRVRAGTIAPVESWETEQVPPLVISTVRRFFRRLRRELTASS